MPTNIPDDDIEWETPSPSGLRSFAKAEATRQGVDPATIEAMFHQESRFNPSAKSKAGAIGVAQLMPATARDLGVDPSNPYDNIRGGITYYKQQLDRFKDPNLARAAYNAGPGAVQKYGGIPPFAETQDYVLKTQPAMATSSAQQSIQDDDIEWSTQPSTPSTNAQQSPTQQPSPQNRTLLEQAKRTAGLATRDILTGITGTAGLVADVPYRLGRVAGIGTNLKLPSERFQEGMTQLGLPEPETTTERATGLATSILAGGTMDPISKLIQAKAGGGQVKQKDIKYEFSERQRAIQEGIDKGFVVSPGQAAAGKGARTLEAFASRPRVEQHTQFLNQFKVDEIARRELRFPPDAPMTRTTIGNAIEDAFERGYGPIKKVATITTGRKYREALNNIAFKYDQAAKDFPAAQRAEVSELVDSHRVRHYSGEGAIAEIRILRENASKAFKNGDTELGKANREVANAIENNIELNLKARKQDVLLSNLRSAREYIAKASDIRDTIEAGNVNAMDLVNKLENNVPLSGGLKQIAEFAQAAPANIGKPGTRKPPMLDIWDIALGSGGIMTGGLPYAGVIGARTGLRNLMMTRPIQKSVMYPRASIMNNISGNPFVDRAMPSVLQTGIFGNDR